jgi:PAS domain S-box-containing protein
MPVVLADLSADSYRLVFDKNPLPILIFDRKTLAFLAVNDAAVRQYGYTREEFLALTAADVRPPDERSRFVQSGPEAAEREHQTLCWRDGIWRHCKKDGTVFAVEIAASLIEFQGRESVLAVAHDITQRHRTEDAPQRAQVANILDTISDTFIALEESLRRSEERHRLIAELSSDYAYTCQVDVDGTIHMDSVTEGFERVTGYALEELQARGDWMSLIHPEDLDRVLREIPAFMAGQRIKAELRIVTKAGAVRWIRYTAQPTTDPKQGRITQLLGAVQDITPLKQAEDDLRQANQVLASIIHACPLAIIAIDPEGRVTTWNPAAERIFGWPREEVLNQPLPIIPPGKEADFRASREVELRGEPRNNSELRRLRNDGRLVDVSVWTAPVWDTSGAVRSTIGIVADITDRKLAEGQLRDQAERLQTLSRRLLEVQEQERRHFARELHDEVGQELTGLKLALEACTQGPTKRIRASLASVLGSVQELTRKVRELSLRLRPTMLDDLGLLPALLWHIERYTAQTGLRVKFEHRGLDRRLYPPEVETAGFRIVQEALTNVARHAHIKEVTVRLWLQENQLLLRVEDQGAGFDPEDVRAAAPSGGLSGMRERATLVGGELEVKSVRGSGTSVAATLPVQGREDRRRPSFAQFAES